MDARRPVLLSTLACGVFALFAGGCTDGVEDIDRTQPNKVRKAVFEGEWYFRQTVVDINGTGTSTFVALEGDGERVKFHFNENSVVARRMHEDVPGIDQPAANIPAGSHEGFTPEKGSPVVAFGVNHLDVIRQYNASTGEQSNVIVENTQDRHWNERDWVRLTWADPGGALMGWDGLLSSRGGAGGQYGAYEPPQDSTEEPDWYVECQAKGSEEIVDCKADNADASYIDVTYTVFRQPSFSECFNNFFSVPGLFYADCGVERVKMRASFAKIRDLDVHGECADCDQTFTMQNDYEPRFYDDFDDKRFGFFRMNRALFDRRWDVRDDNVRQLAQLRSIWKRYTDGNGNSLPYHQRVPKPITYYVNSDHPYDLLDEMALISDDYNVAFQRIVFALSNSQGTTKYNSIEDVPRMFYICSNPGPSEGDEPAFTGEIERLTNLGEAFASELTNFQKFYEQSNEGYRIGACKRPGDIKALGDVRYSYFNFINVPNQTGPLGYGPSSADPISGELINGTSNAYGAAIDYYAQYLLDLINIVHGDVEPSDIGYGKNVSAYFADVRARYEDGSATMSADPGVNSATSVQGIRADVAKVLQQERRIKKLEKIAAEKLADPQVKRVLNSGDEFLRLRNDFQRNPAQAFKGTVVEQKLIFPEIIEAAEKGQLGMMADEADIDESNVLGAIDTSNPGVLDKVSPLRGMSVKTLSQQTRARDIKFLNKRIHMAEDFFDPKFMGWAREARRLKDAMAGKGLSPEAIQENLWYWVRGKSYLGLQEHEVGHSLGLRHNFAGSTDSLNFFPQYWALRQQSFNPNCDGGDWKTFDAVGLATRRPAPGTCDANGFLSAATPEEHADTFLAMMEGRDDARGIEFAAGLETYATASIMEYGATFGLNDQAGLAMYDYAALAYGYGNLVEVFNQPPYKVEVEDHYDADDDFDPGPSTFTRSNTLVTTMLDVDINDRVNDGVRVPDDPLEQDVERYGYRGSRDHEWHYWHYSTIPMMFYDANQDPSAADVAKLQISPRVSFEGIGPMWKLYDRTLMPLAQAEAEQKVQVPYKYCEDLFAGSSNYDCMRWDTGADNLEVLTTIIERYNAYHPVSDFRRGRLTFGLFYSFGRLVDRTFGRALRAYQFWLLDASARGVSWYNRPEGGQASLIAAIDGINFLGGILTKPSVGTYAYSTRDDRLVNFDTESQGVGESGLTGQARKEWDFSDGNLFTLDLSNGARFQYDQFVERENGERPYYFPFMMQTFSHFWHKLFAMQMLVEGGIDVLGADTASNNNSFFIQPTIVFKDEIFRYFAGMVNEDFERYIGICVETDEDGNVVTRGAGDNRAANWEPIDMIHNAGAGGCDEGFRLVNPYTRAYGNADFNARYFATFLGAVGFIGNLDYDWIDTAGLYIKGTGNMPELAEELEDTFDVWEFTDTVGISNGLTYVAYCPTDYEPGDSEQPRQGCDLIARMNDMFSVLQARRIEEAIDNGDLFPVQVGDDPMNPAEPEEVAAVLERPLYAPRNFSEYFDLQGHQEMARYHLEILSRIF